MPLWMAATEDRILDAMALLKAEGRDVLHRLAVRDVRKAVDLRVDRIKAGKPVSDAPTAQNRKVGYVLNKGGQEVGRADCVAVLVSEGTQGLVDADGRLFLRK